MTQLARRVTPRLALGSLAILVGVALTLDNLGLLDAGRLLRLWPLALVAIGVARLRGWATADLIVGLLWIFLGGWILAYNYRVVALNPFDFVVPILLLALGTRLASGAVGSRAWGWREGPASGALAVFGANARRVSTPGLRHGDATAIFGGCELDLTQAGLAGEGAVIDVFALWGGIDVRVPSGWQIISRVTPVLGSFTDETAQQPPPGAPRLEIRGAVIMGGVTVKN